MRSSYPLICGFSLLSLLVAGCAHHTGGEAGASRGSEAKSNWSVTLDNIEACSCPAFCQCYFSGQPALHAGAGERAMRYCRFNNAFRVSKGHYGDTKLDGLKFWMAGDLGGDFSKGMDWAVLRFEPSATPEQRKAAEAIVHAIFPVKWNSFTAGADVPIDWQKTDDGAVARLDGGKSGEIVLTQSRDKQNNPVVIKNVQFWAAPKNTGFLVMKSEIEAYRDGAKPFEFKQTNGFFTTITMSEADIQGAHASASSGVQLMRAMGSETIDCCEADSK